MDKQVPPPPLPSEYRSSAMTTLIHRHQGEFDNGTTLFCGWITVGLVPAQDGPIFYTLSHLSALQNCALLFSTNFSLFSYLKNA